nr:immunoglobulin light chain junction region [Macaca mulatta]MOX85450.1 immunoglobulin light chain junction region [Macaca mulatta]MOX85480.1 immunoglobulin light chain junction region [Macaca mulatta]MOX85547.1 immunoglobulin light chain junction region [Macaca mulatta]MOX85729.1 immunoglobulin light chain junction region [Macaca mulatta]
CMQDKQLPPTF